MVLREAGGTGHALAADTGDEVDARVGRMLENLGRAALGIVAVPGALNAPAGQIHHAGGLGKHELVEVVRVVKIEVGGVG